jgi:NitT/TauT family transport system substrate-binding protein
MKRFLPLLVLVPALVAGCNSASTPQQTTSDGLVKITVANLAVTNSAALVLGVQKGFFRSEGLDVTLKDTPAASTQAAVVSGEAQFAFTNVPAILAAASNGLPVRIVGPAGKYARDNAKVHIQVAVPADSPIRTAKDLEGRKLAVDTLFQLPHLSFIISARSAGVDTSKITFVETPYPAMADALAKKQVDAADLGEPFLTPELAKGARSIISNGVGFAPETVQTMWVTSASYLAEHRDTVDRFTRALQKSNEYASGHDGELRQVLTTYTKTSADLSSKILMPYFSPSSDRENFEIYYQTMKELGVIKKDVDLNTLFVS